MTLSSKQDLVLHLQAALRDFVFPAFLAPWYSGLKVELLMDLEAVAIFVAWRKPGQQLE